MTIRRGEAQNPEDGAGARQGAGGETQGNTMIRPIRPCLPRPEHWVPFLDPAYADAHFSNFGPVYERFASSLTEKYCAEGRLAIPVASGTIGLTATLMALGIRGRVVIPSYTFVATGQAVLAAGCTPVFGDVDPLTWALSPRDVQALAAEDDVGAVMVVRTFGLGQDLTELAEICKRFNLPLISDSAASLGGKLEDGNWIGNQATAEVFSLNATKVFGVGEGGVVFCPAEFSQKIRSTINFGLCDRQICNDGMNGKLDEFSSAIGLAMLGIVDQHVENRQRYAQFYVDKLSPLIKAGVITLPPQRNTGTNWVFPISIKPDYDVTSIQQRAESAGLQLGQWYATPLHASRLFKKYAGSRKLEVTDSLSNSVVCLPIYSEMHTSLLETICAVMLEVLQG